MAEIFLADLTQVKLFDILAPLLNGKKTGKMMVRGKEGGELYLELGNITYAKTDNAIGEHAFFTLMGLKVGKASFEPDEVPFERNISISTEQLLTNWSFQKQERDKMREIIPSPNAVFHLSPQKSPENKNINAEQWNVLALCNGEKSILEISKTLGWDESRTSKVIFQLVQLGLLEKGELKKPSNKKPVSENFFLILEAELKKVFGPMAPFIINDKLSDLGETKGSLAQDDAQSFVEAISGEISQDSKKKEFLKVMTDFILSGKKRS